MAAGWEVIIPFLRCIESLLRDPDISDILINGNGTVYFEKAGRAYRFQGIGPDERSLQVAVRNIARVLGNEISEERPTVNARLPDGSRLAAVLGGVSVGGTSVAIRRLQAKRFDLAELVRIGTCPADALELLQSSIDRRWNIVISGGTGTGKTTLLNALAASIDVEDRLLVIEDTAEIQVPHANVVRFEARRPQPGLPAVCMRELLEIALRFRPDRILVGEVRGAETFELLQALNTGHSGTLSTTHADSAAATLRRLATCVMTAAVLPYAIVRAQLAEGLHLIVHLERRADVRRISEIVRIRGYDAAHDRFDLEPLYARS